MKQKLVRIQHRPPFVNEGDIWWFSLGENVGSEIGGKSDIFTRPAIVYRKLAAGFYLVVPTTSKTKMGNWYVPFKHQGRNMWACLHQVRTVDHRRLWSKIGRLDDEDYKSVQEGFRLLYL